MPSPGVVVAHRAASAAYEHFDRSLDNAAAAVRGALDKLESKDTPAELTGTSAAN